MMTHPLKSILLPCFAAVAAVSLAVARPAAAEVVPSPLFSDHAVLQAGVKVPVWGTARPGEKITVAVAGKTAFAAADSNGKWTAHLPALPSGGPYTLVVKGDNTLTLRDILVGEVWLASGQSNMDFTVARTEKKYFAGTQNEAEEIAAANYPQIRQFTVDLKMTESPQTELTGHWSVCSPQTVGDFSAVAYFFARDLHRTRKFPVGIIDATWGASTAEAWTSRNALVAVPELKPLVVAFDAKLAAYTPEAAAQYAAAQAAYKAAVERARAENQKIPRAPRGGGNPRSDQHNATVLYNGMIHPVAPYALRGAIWYQGESNGPTADIYNVLMRTMIADWRREWGIGDFPFLFVQLANINKPQTEPYAGSRGVARVREGQLQTLLVPYTAMATAIDIGDANNVHPKNKQEVGRRLALAARATVYGEKIPYSGPLYAGMSIEGNAARLRFTHTSGGLVSRGENGKLTGFTVAGVDGKWVWADARIDGETVVVTSPLAPAPTAVRYGWADNPPLSLYNGAGLPASPFRTDGAGK